jgi:diketogulonate reductase-like aldo/keto reductase
VEDGRALYLADDCLRLPELNRLRRVEGSDNSGLEEVELSEALPAAVELNDGRVIPQLGLGVFQLRAGREAQQAVEAALEAGYRHIDTASVYGNEADVGRALRASGLDRDVWITTKLWNSDHGGDGPRRALAESLDRLGLDAVDLYLIHWPTPERLDTWGLFEQFRDQGPARSIGVSNFLTNHLDELLPRARLLPAVNQIEMSPFLYRTRLDTVTRTLGAGIALEAYSPLTRGRRLDHPQLQTIARAHGKTPAQVLIRWCLDKGFVVIPRSSKLDRIRENADVFDFSLDERELAGLDALDENLTTGWNPAGWAE